MWGGLEKPQKLRAPDGGDIMHSRGEEEENLKGGVLGPIEVTLNLEDFFFFCNTGFVIVMSSVAGPLQTEGECAPGEIVGAIEWVRVLDDGSHSRFGGSIEIAKAP
jgi:hypothetical protein